MGFRFLVVLQLLAFLFATATVPARAAVLGNGDFFAGAEARQNLGAAGSLLTRTDVQAQLMALGVSPQDAIERVSALAPAELAVLNDRLNELPAGGSVLGLLGAVFVVLLVLELVGVTNVFSSL